MTAMRILPTDPGRRGAVVALIGVLAVLYLVHEYGFLPRQREIERLQDRIVALESTGTRLRQMQGEGIPELEARLASYELHLRRMEELVPRGDEVPALLEWIASEARKAGLGDLVALAPHPPGVPDPYRTARYDLAVTGGYHEIGRFFTAIASLPRIVLPHRVELTAMPVPGGAAADAPPAIRAEFSVETYLRPDPLPDFPSVPIAGRDGGP